MTYRKKAELISKYCPDLVVVPECEHLGEETAKNLWFGDDQNKGIGIFSYSDFELELNKKYNPSFRYVIPINVNGPGKFNLIAVWAKDDAQDVRKRYIGQVYSALNYYKDLLDERTIIIGDFNWNVIWDNKPSYPLYGNITDVIEILKNRKIKSAYHDFFEEDYGKETKPTFYMYKSQNKPYHIDYCFVSSDFYIGDMQVGNFDDWIKISDHMPLIITFKDR